MTTPFNVEALRDIYDEETKGIAHWELLENALELKQDSRDVDYLQYIPKTLQYIKDRIFHAETGEYYVLTYHRTVGCGLTPLSKNLLEKNLYINYLPPIVQKWWSTYAKLYQVCDDATKERVFSEEGVSYINLYEGAPLKNTLQATAAPQTAPQPSITTATPSLTEFFKRAALQSNETEFNEHRTPKTLYDLYSGFCEDKELPALKYHGFYKELKELPFIGISSIRKNGKNATNYILANRELCRAVYLEVGVLTLEEVLTYDAEEEADNAEAATAANLKSSIIPPLVVAIVEPTITEAEYITIETDSEEEEEEAQVQQAASAPVSAPITPPTTKYSVNDTLFAILEF